MAVWDTELLERTDAVTVATLIEAGFVEHTPLMFTAKGRRWLKAREKAVNEPKDEAFALRLAVRRVMADTESVAA